MIRQHCSIIAPAANMIMPQMPRASLPALLMFGAKNGLIRIAFVTHAAAHSKFKTQHGLVLVPV
jgi:hypothetical protein